MSRYVRGPVLPDLETAVFCLLAGDMLYHERAILPACQIASWSFNKIKACVLKGKLYKAEFLTGV